MKNDARLLLRRLNSGAWPAPSLWWGLLAAAALVLPARAAQVWNGPLLTFNEPGTDPTQAANQDRLTPKVWITRGPIEGIFNAAQEAGYTHFSSPTDTEWAYGDLSNYASLSYTNWERWSGQHPPSMVGRGAVVHLISEDIYVAVTFTSWGGSSGGFAYQRSTPTPPVPAQLEGSLLPSPGGFRVTFTNLPGYTFTLLATTNVSLPATTWPVLGVVTDAPAGSGLYGFTDPAAPSTGPRKFYRLRWP